ncbi:formate-dependent phosphoribosylglycinamide formyltransferase [Corynebacterium sp. HS2168-gen11]|uniref:formate-dependent phosphoribosylglycinamide formyltransferase n=1 Tax=Corynebacterium sp. HS2168-gen11 TaxID=2974027 RepID=UPI00216B4E4A|nr:formate-dependent phosphoribosylglycinamide formyltransferase [Corynebacterium sp. HS2168-gen11]MCS4536152.1 formate-dependent phosphoribosylglycinamide formyltransferase [Corynebacterium sp. HS2168-gen11]
MFTPEYLGTPLSPSATRVMIFGAGELGKELAIAFQRLGVEVHAVDHYDHAPAQQVAHFSHTLDLNDAAAIRRLVDQVRPNFIVPEIEALATSVLADFELSGMTVVPTARATELTMNREEIRQLAAHDLGLPTPPHQFAGTYEEYISAVHSIDFPCVVKPVMSSSGRGQFVLHTIDDIPAAWEHSQRFAEEQGIPTRVIIEQFINFDYEVTLLAVRSVDPATGQDATWFCEPIGHRQEHGRYVESWQPMPMSQTALETSRSIAARITGALGGRGVFGVELFVSGDDVYFSEVSPSPHDTGMVTLSSQRLNEFELHARAILGLPIDVTLTSPGASAVIRATSDLDHPRYSGLSQAMQVPETDVKLFGKPSAYASRRMGLCISTADDVETARLHAQTAAAAIRVE